MTGDALLDGYLMDELGMDPDRKRRFISMAFMIKLMFMLFDG
jgi:hypothetical protein